jgi:hypothetical protein
MRDKKKRGDLIDSDKLVELNDQLDTIIAEDATLCAEFQARGRWTRYYLALSHNGHVHSSMSCSTCNNGRYSTQFIRLDSEAGMSAEAVVAKARSKACTVCFKDAPTVEGDCEYRTPDQEEKDRKAAELAARKAAADAKKIFVPGSTPPRPLCEARMTADGTFRDSYEIKTAVSAQRMLLQCVTDMACYGPGNNFQDWQETARRCAEALEAKLGVSQRLQFAEAITKVTKKAKREGWSIRCDLAAQATPRP